jgi:hypothetical protein
MLLDYGEFNLFLTFGLFFFFFVIFYHFFRGLGLVTQGALHLCGTNTLMRHRKQWKG